MQDYLSHFRIKNFAHDIEATLQKTFEFRLKSMIFNIENFFEFYESFQNPCCYC